MKAFGIFEGGGAKGFAHIGALKAAEIRRVKFVGVAGASAGAIVASLVAAEYKSDDLFNPKASIGLRGILDKNFLDFLSADGWNSLQTVKTEVEALTGNGLQKSRIRRFGDRFRPTKIALTWKDINLFCIRNRVTLSNVWAHRGLFSTEDFVIWLDNHLAQRVKRNSKVNRVVFEDMPIPLAVITTDLTSQSIKVFSKTKTPKISVADAVAASISIPFIFKPFILEESELVDGGLLSNFPAWVFDDERQQMDEYIPTFGFKLHNAIAAESVLKTKTTFDFLADLFSTALSGDGVLEIRAIENMNLIPVKVRANTLDFDIPFERKEDLYVYGKDSATDFFRDFIGPSNPEDIFDVLSIARSHVVQAMQKNAVLRSNVTMPVGQKKDKLRILYAFNMNKDSDDRMEFGLDVGAVGQCWQSHLAVVADLGEKSAVHSLWKLSKYQLALIRPTLKSVLSVPIFDLRKFDNSKPAVENPMLGVLSVDSDEDLLAEFAKENVQQALADAAKLIASRLQQ